jgi:hypothetical protein
LPTDKTTFSITLAPEDQKEQQDENQSSFIARTFFAFPHPTQKNEGITWHPC